ncbi:Zinc finger PHD-type [Penicillium citrinum]|uniref:Chromatin modification-related protein n=1 Tax=Penicillium citrinum TaxID=5077 RepID=A0A9W9P405_PENCI|nr:Zinc finger PHD-type [Penicillium citrinum]KAJ5235008.1 Zinc finger PHD-type [Penicillium citrinum]
MPMTDETDHSGGVILDGPFDPDAQATVTDYIDYTEYLPADIIRSLTLIRGLDDRYLESAQSVHDFTKRYGQLPDIASDERPSAIELRRDISLQLDRAINARESSYAEACRLYDVVDRHFDRLSCIRQKLDALPRPPSEEPTPPEPTPKRSRKKENASTTRITLRLDNRKRSNTQKSRSRRAGLTAEHLANFNPDSPIDNHRRKRNHDDLALARDFPQAMLLHCSNHPPEDAKIGSQDLPWLRLTEWEMTKLRKKMKKNAVWQPSEVMIHRELALSGRGWEAYRTAKALALETGEEFVDCDNLEETRHEEMIKDLEETKLSNRGMKLNEAKKLKRELLAREAAANGDTPAKPAASLLTTPASRSSRKRKRDEIAAEAAIEDKVVGGQEIALEPTTVPLKEAASKSSSTRRRSSRGAAASGSADGTNAPITSILTQGSPMVETKASPPPPSPTGSRRSTRSIIQPTGTPTPPVTRPSSRRSAAASLEFGALGGLSTNVATGGRDFRIKSATPARKTPVREASHAPSVPAPTRRRKRPAPGPVSTGQDGGAAVSYGRRKAKPGKKRISTGKSQETRVDEDGVLEEIDSNEPRYCLCGDVSFGTMICCENQDCDREWFHLDCVGLSEVPSRTAKWYCPECRVKFHKGPDGIVKGGRR